MAFEDPNAPLVKRQFSTDVPPNKRIEILSAPFNKIDFYSGDATETEPAQISTELSELVFEGPALESGPGARLSLGQESLIYQPFGGGANTFYGAMYSADNTMAPVMANDDNNDASAQTTSTAYVALVGSTGPQPNPFNTMPAPVSGRVKVHISCDMSPSNAGGICVTSFQLRDLNNVGALLAGATDSRSILYQADAANGRASFGATFFLEGISAFSGTLYFQMLHRVANAATLGTFRRRKITVEPCL